MIYLVAGLIVLAGLFFIVMRRDVIGIQKATLGGRMPPGCAVAEGIAIILFGVFLAVAYYAGWY